MSEDEKQGAVICGATIRGPKYGRLVAWRRQCQNRTTHPTGRCHLHRPDPVDNPTEDDPKRGG